MKTTAKLILYLIIVVTLVLLLGSCAGVRQLKTNWDQAARVKPVFYSPVHHYVPYVPLHKHFTPKHQYNVKYK